MTYCKRHSKINVEFCTDVGQHETVNKTINQLDED